jgi:hypothetical protein
MFILPGLAFFFFFLKFFWVYGLEIKASPSSEADENSQEDSHSEDAPSSEDDENLQEDSHSEDAQAVKLMKIRKKIRTVFFSVGFNALEIKASPSSEADEDAQEDSHRCSRRIRRYAA